MEDDIRRMLKAVVLSVGALLYAGGMHGGARLPEPDLSGYGSASILPVMRGNDGEWYMLLGIRSRHSRSGAGELGDFGGLRDRGEDNPFRTARREFNEETKGVFRRGYQLELIRKLFFCLFFLKIRFF